MLSVLGGDPCNALVRRNNLEDVEVFCENGSRHDRGFQGNGFLQADYHT